MNNETKASTKLCPHCQKEIPKGAKKCPECQSDLRSWINRHPILTVLGALIMISVVLSSVNDAHDKGVAASAPPAPAAPSQARTLGQEAFLRLPDNNDATQLICLAPTEAVYQEYFKALSAQDYQGIVGLADEGLFCVHNGSEVKVIDTSFGYTKVRVVKGVAKIDDDKVGEAGWSASEWVLTQ